MKSKVVVIWNEKNLWFVYDFNSKELQGVAVNKEEAVKFATHMVGYRIYIAYDVKLCKQALEKGNKVAYKKMEAILKGMFDQSHLRFTRTKIVKE